MLIGIHSKQQSTFKLCLSTWTQPSSCNGQCSHLHSQMNAKTPPMQSYTCSIADLCPCMIEIWRAPTILRYRSQTCTALCGTKKRRSSCRQVGPRPLTNCAQHNLSDLRWTQGRDVGTLQFVPSGRRLVCTRVRLGFPFEPVGPITPEELDLEARPYSRTLLFHTIKS